MGELKKWALITGATSGIGEATAIELGKKGFSLWLTGRRKARLAEFQKKWSSEFPGEIRTSSFDLTDYEACKKSFHENNDICSELHVLVNNAGLARGVDAVDRGEVNDWDVMIDTNIKGLLYVSRLALPHLKKLGKNSHIINLGSISGHRVYSGGVVYCATKHAITAFSQGLRLDLHGSGVRVTNISPGMVETEFSEVRMGDSDKAKKVYQGMDPLTAVDIARSIAWAVDQPVHVNIQEMVIMPTDQADVGVVHRS